MTDSPTDRLQVWLKIKKEKDEQEEHIFVMYYHPAVYNTVLTDLSFPSNVFGETI